MALLPTTTQEVIPYHLTATHSLCSHKNSLPPPSIPSLSFDADGLVDGWWWLCDTTTILLDLRSNKVVSNKFPPSTRRTPLPIALTSHVVLGLPQVDGWWPWFWCCQWCFALQTICTATSSSIHMQLCPCSCGIRYHPPAISHKP